MEKILKQLVSFETLTKNQKENLVALDWVEKQIGSHLIVKRFKRNGYHSLVASGINDNPQIISRRILMLLTPAKRNLTPENAVKNFLALANHVFGQIRPRLQILGRPQSYFSSFPFFAGI